MTKIFTIGHSTRKLNNFIAILIQNRIKCLVDVRSYPSSTYAPQFNEDSLKTKLAKYDIKYYHIKELGGRRHYPNIHHPALTSSSFSSYAEYMMTDSFKKGIKELKHIARQCRTAYMCAEAVWWRCHRRMISDRLEFDGWDVYHLGIKKEPIRHTIWDLARLDRHNEIIYDKVPR
jgi:uncharacterized protein (DUF488 family)